MGMMLIRCRPIALLLLMLHLAACTSWQLSTVSPPQLIQEEEPGLVRLTQMNGDRSVVDNPEIRGDSIVSGDTRSCKRLDCRRSSVVISDIAQIEVGRPSQSRTAALVAIFVLSPIVVLAIGMRGFSILESSPFSR